VRKAATALLAFLMSPVIDEQPPVAPHAVAGELDRQAAREFFIKFGGTHRDPRPLVNKDNHLSRRVIERGSV